MEARGKTLGIIGYGHIGMQLGILAETLGMKVRFYDIETKLPLGNASQAPTMTALLKEADVISLHVPETPQTQNMMGTAEFEVMKDGVIFINASRGTVVDIEALSEALANKKVAGAAIDVFPVEPKGNDEEFISPLRAFDNVILTPPLVVAQKKHKKILVWKSRVNSLNIQIMAQRYQRLTFLKYRYLNTLAQIGRAHV